MPNTKKAEQPAPSELLTVDEIATQLRVDVVTIRRWITDGQLSPAYKVGKGYRVPRTVLDQFLGRAQVITR